MKLLSHVQLFETPWTVAHQAPLSMGFSRQESWSGLPCPPSGDLLDPGNEPHLLHLLIWQASSLPLALSRKPNSKSTGREQFHKIPRDNSIRLYEIQPSPLLKDSDSPFLINKVSCVTHTHTHTHTHTSSDCSGKHSK